MTKGDPLTALRNAAEAFRQMARYHEERTRTWRDGLGKMAALDKAQRCTELAAECEAAIPTLYALGLLVEESGEILQVIGKGMRFGLDVPGIKRFDGSLDMEKTPRTMLPVEVGDLGAAATYATKAGLIDGRARCDAENAKLSKLLDPEATDGTGNRLAPAV